TPNPKGFSSTSSDVPRAKRQRPSHPAMAFVVCGPRAADTARESKPRKLVSAAICALDGTATLLWESHNRAYASAPVVSLSLPDPLEHRRRQVSRPRGESLEIEMTRTTTRKLI